MAGTWNNNIYIILDILNYVFDMSLTKQRLYDYEEKQKLPYYKMTDKELLTIVNHDNDHDCRCTDPEGSCNVCFRAWEVLGERGISNGHYY